MECIQKRCSILQRALNLIKSFKTARMEYKIGLYDTDRREISLRIYRRNYRHSKPRLEMSTKADLYDNVSWSVTTKQKL